MWLLGSHHILCQTVVRPSHLGLKIKIATWIFITALVFLEVVIRMNVVFFFFFNGGNVTIRGGEGEDGRN